MLPNREMENFSFSEHFYIDPVLFLPLESSQLVTGLALQLSDKHLSKQLNADSTQLVRNNEGNVLTALYNISLAGDLEGKYNFTSCYQKEMHPLFCIVRYSQ